MLGKVMGFVATAQADKALVFYRDVVGLRFVEEMPFALVFDSGGTMIRVQKAAEVVAAPYTALGWEVADLRAAVKTLAARGATFLRVPGLPQDADGVWTTPDGAQIAWFKDPDGNTLSLTHFPR